MPMTTFLHDGELDVPTSNHVLNALLAQVRAATGENWQITERTWIRYGFLRRTEHRRIYDLYVYVGGCGPWQVINFYRESGKTINQSNSAELVAAYLHGLLGGIDHAKRNP